MNLIPIEGRCSTDVRKSLADALERVDECDNVVVIMQKKVGGLLWFSPDNRTISETHFLVNSFAFHLMCAVAGVVKL